jgi:D-alanyl-D-alanine carboxypeptidase/D-alanyl-D-alanine-endopeptidase (penicillin-binding protein 4)
MRKVCFVLVPILFANLITAQRISQKKLLRQLHKIPELNQAFTGVFVQQLQGNKASTQLNANRYMTPASNTKLLTFLGAVESFYKLPVLNYAIDKNRIYHFKSTAYPLLLHPFYPDLTLLGFFSNQSSWVYHTAATAPKEYGSGWSWDDYNYYYAAPRSVFPIYGNSVQAVLEGGNPKLSPSFVVEKSFEGQNLEREQFSNHFKFNPTQWKVNDTVYRPFIPSDSLFVKLLEESTNTKVSFPDHRNDSLVWKSLYTDQEERLYKGLLHQSDNGIAEALLLMIANKYKGVFLPEVAIDSLKSQWEPWLPDPIEWVDGSGVSRYNMVTPRTLVAVLQQIEAQIGWEKIQILFPKSGVSGTLKAYTKLENVYAKTGTLRHNHNLSGYWISPKGNRYAFAILVNHFTASTSEIREGITELLTWMQRKLK